MIAPIQYVYVAVVCAIRAIKWVELQFLRVLKPYLRLKAGEIVENIGVVYQYPNEVTDNHNQRDPKEEARVLSKCKGKYDKIVRVNVLDDNYFVKAANEGTLGCGEAYMDKMFDCDCEDDVVEYAKRVLENDMLDLYLNAWNRTLEHLELRTFNLQTRARSFQVGKEHYDLGNDLYELMLDPWMQYTCAYWAKADNLIDASLDKLELIAKKLQLQPGQRVLDIGCGWGTLCKYLAQNYGVEVVGVTISAEGYSYGKAINKGLPVDIRLQDYRDVNEVFDRVVSIGCFEHVGYHNYKEFMQVARRCLKDDGIFLVHTIARNHPNFPRTEPWLHRYIFPNGQLPNPEDMVSVTKDLWIIEDWHNFGPDYAKTLKAWRHNFNQNWHKIQHKYGERFRRMWIYYLCVSEAAFLSRRTQLWQLVLSKDGLKREYRAAR